MEILGIGPLEFLLIVLLALIILGPKELQKVGKSLGQNLNKLVKSDVWKDIRQTSEKVKNLPTELMRDAEMNELMKTLQEPLEGQPKDPSEPAAPGGLPAAAETARAGNPGESDHQIAPRIASAPEGEKTPTGQDQS
jgi:sec-independent protein translocase protein TatB